VLWGGSKTFKDHLFLKLIFIHHSVLVSLIKTEEQFYHNYLFFQEIFVIFMHLRREWANRLPYTSRAGYSDCLWLFGCIRADSRIRPGGCPSAGISPPFLPLNALPDSLGNPRMPQGVTYKRILVSLQHEKCL